MPDGLTSRQLKFLNVIREYMKSHDGVAPSYRQMADAMGLKSTSGAFRLMECLERRGHVRRVKGSARSLELIEKAASEVPSRLRLFADELDVLRGFILDARCEGIELTSVDIGSGDLVFAQALVFDGEWKPIGDKKLLTSKL
jgi:hypothetical protein